jgi:hypothetical protein
MRKFIIISLLSAMTLPTLACIWGERTNPYLFSLYRQTEFRELASETCDNNWQAYLGTSEDYFWFNADEIIKAAQKKNDALMVSYVKNLQKYLSCVDVEQAKQNEWSYPTKEDIDTQQRNLQAVRTYAFNNSKTKLRSQHALLYMRCNMMLGRHQENISYWEQTASQLIETVYKDMMKNIYAGALYKTGQEEKAGELFAEMGDYQSLMTQFYRKRSFQAICQHYQKNPNSKVLPFLLQDFVNNCQEVIDANGEEWFDGKLFVRKINEQEAKQMIRFCETVTREGKTETPIMWKSAQAWLEYLYGQKKQATTDILEASKFAGTDRMKDCARVLMLFITANQAPDTEAFDNYLAEELAWLKEMQKQEPDGYFHRAETRLSHQALMNHYQNNIDKLIAMMDVTNNYNYSSYIDTMRVSQLEKYFAYTNTPAKTNLDKFLKANIKKDEQAMTDLIGTKYLRLCQWDKAIKWLTYVPASFYNEAGYRMYVLLRKISVEPWITRQWIKDSDEAKAREYNWTVRENPKLLFAKEMQMMEGTINVLSGKALCQRYYNLATYYAQANFTGDCWWLMRDGKSVGDTLRVNEVDLRAKTKELLQKASQTTDFALKEKALFALSYGELYEENQRWFIREWNNETYEYDRKTCANASQYLAFATLANFEKQNATRTNKYVSRCDEYIQFRKQFH